MPHHDKKKEEDSGLTLSRDLLEALARFQEIELENFELNAKELEISFEPGMAARMIPQLAKAPAVAAAIAAAKGKPTQLLKATFTPPVETYPGKITEVKLGATRGEGGTRGRSVIVGGETSPAFYSFERPMTHPPVVTLDVFDMEVPLSKAV